MQTMKCDMAGAAAVVGATVAIAATRAAGQDHGVRVPSPRTCRAVGATRPGDVLTMRSGTTVEVLNTDAEGRLVLADGLALAAEAKPDRIVDVATLTGRLHRGPR